MSNYDFTIVIEPDEGGFHAFVPILSGCHSFGESVAEAKKNIAEAIELHVESMLEEGEEIPLQREPVLVTRLSIPIAA